MDNTVGDDCKSSKLLNVNTFKTVGTTLDLSAFADVEVAQAA